MADTVDGLSPVRRASSARETCRSFQMRLSRSAELRARIPCASTVNCSISWAMGLLYYRQVAPSMSNPRPAAAARHPAESADHVARRSRRRRRACTSSASCAELHVELRLPAVARCRRPCRRGTRRSRRRRACSRRGSAPRDSRRRRRRRRDRSAPPQSPGALCQKTPAQPCELPPASLLGSHSKWRQPAPPTASVQSPAADEAQAAVAHVAGGAEGRLDGERGRRAGVAFVVAGPDDVVDVEGLRRGGAGDPAEAADDVVAIGAADAEDVERRLRGERDVEARLELVGAAGAEARRGTRRSRRPSSPQARKRTWP